jgi:hypothetical protein
VIEIDGAGAVDGGRGAEGVHEGGEGEPGASGRAAPEHEVLRWRFHRPRGHRRRRVHSTLARRDGGGRRSARPEPRGGAPSSSPMGKGVPRERSGGGVPAGQGSTPVPLLRDPGQVHLGGKVHAADLITWSSLFGKLMTCCPTFLCEFLQLKVCGVISCWVDLNLRSS